MEMVVLRLALAAYLVLLTAYSAVVIYHHGWNLLPVFFGDIAAMTWPGQFNFDFTGFLLVSAFWTAWRHRFSPLGLALGILAFFGGMMFLSIYLLVESAKARTIGQLVTQRAAQAA